MIHPQDRIQQQKQPSERNEKLQGLKGTIKPWGSKGPSHRPTSLISLMSKTLRHACPDARGPHGCL
jgi:hypothetical protein